MTKRRGGGHAGGPGSHSSEPTGRMKAVRVRAGNRSESSKRWLIRQLNDPYVAEAQRRGLRSRAAFKLMQLDERFTLLRPGLRVIDLGAAPGGWSQIAVERVRAAGGGLVVGCDLLDVAPLAGATFVVQDFLAPEASDRMKALLGGPADLVLSDMAAPTTGHARTDHLRVVGLCEAALDFAETVLAPGGTFVAKVFQGGTEGELLARLKRLFATVRHAKPAASRAESAEMYVVAQGFRGAEGDAAPQNADA